METLGALRESISRLFSLSKGNIQNHTGSSAGCAVMTQKGRMEVGWKGGLKRKGIYVYLQLIHVVVQQKLTQYCKAIIFQFLKIKKKKNHRQNSTFGTKCITALLDRVNGPQEVNSVSAQFLGIVYSWQKSSLTLIEFGIYLKEFKLYLKFQIISDFSGLGKIKARELLEKKRGSVRFSLKQISFMKILVFYPQRMLGYISLPL